MGSPLATPPEVLKLAGHAVRWNLLMRLARSDYRVQELVEYLKLPQNLVSYHLRQLRSGNLVTERRSSADERSVYYGLDVEQFRSLYLKAGEQLHPALNGARVPLPDEGFVSRQVPLRVLFLCTENSARSQMAEVLLREFSHGNIEVYSAGSSPAEHIHPLALRVMEQRGCDMSHARPKQLEQFRRQHFDTIVTVCDSMREVCPTFPNDPELIHWSFPDPAQVEGSEEARYHAFEHTAQQLATRTRLLLTQLMQGERTPGKGKL